MKSTEKQSFWVGGFRYELTLKSPGAIALHLVDGYVRGIGNIRGAYRERDLLATWDEYDPNEFGLIDDLDFDVPVFQLTRECINRIADWANRVQPGFFVISTKSNRKQRVYERLMPIIQRKVNGFSYQKMGSGHYFYRIPITSQSDG